MFEHNLCLILDTFCRPLRIASYKDAITLIYSRPEIAEVLESYDEVIRSPSTTLNLPCIIKLNSKSTAKRFKIGFRTLNPSKKNIYIRDGGNCVYCDKELTLNEATLDHRIAKSKGGLTTSDNLVLSCSECNQEKSNKHPKNYKPVKRSTNTLNYNSYIKSGVLKSRFPEIWLKYLPE